MKRTPRFAPSLAEKPRKDEMYFPRAICPFSYFCAVPVLPRISYPATYAPLPLPDVTTLFSNSRIVSDVCLDTTLSPPEKSVSATSFPLQSTNLFATCAFTLTPPLTTLEVALSSPIGVTATACPNPILARSTFLTRFWSINIPLVSPVTSMPVFLPSPKARK